MHQDWGGGTRGARIWEKDPEPLAPGGGRCVMLSEVVAAALDGSHGPDPD